MTTQFKVGDRITLINNPPSFGKVTGLDETCMVVDWGGHRIAYWESDDLRYIRLADAIPTVLSPCVVKMLEEQCFVSILKLIGGGYCAATGRDHEAIAETPAAALDALAKLMEEKSNV